MEYFTSNDGYKLAYLDIGSKNLPPLILLHGFTGSSAVFQRNISAYTAHFRTIVPDLRGHGASAKPPHSFHVSRLAMDLQNLLSHLSLLSTPHSIRVLGGSLGCAILWCHAELFTADIFSHEIWVDQAPMQNYAVDGTWGSEFGNRGMNSSAAVATLKATLKYDPDAVYRGTIAGCLGYRSHPTGNEKPEMLEGGKVWRDDEEFFLNIARLGNAEWYGDLMADHTALDWRKSISECFGGRKENRTKVLVVASSRSGCFPAKGCMEAVRLINEKIESGKEKKAEGVVVNWGGHWCYWEEPELFNEMVLKFLVRGEKGL